MTPPDAPARPSRRREPSEFPARDRTLFQLLAYRTAQATFRVIFILQGGFRTTGGENVPERGAALLVSNHMSFWDVFVLGIGIRRPLNFVARSSLFTPMLGPVIRTFGTFPIKQDGFGSQGFKETLRRLKAGSIVTFFPEGTRSPDGSLQELKPGIAALAIRARLPVLPVGIVGTFEAWPRHRKFPRPHPLGMHVGLPISPEEFDGLSTEEATERIRQGILQAIDTARQASGR